MATSRSILKASAYSLLTAFGWFKVRCSRKPKLLIFTYHRVLPTGHPNRKYEQSGMITSPEALLQHIQSVKRLGAQPVHVHEWIEKNQNGASLPPLSVAFTFDDGWKDNYDYAYPVLRKHQIPFTIFLVSELIDTNNTFWPERVLSLLRADNVPLDDLCFDWLRETIHAVVSEPANLPLDLSNADLVIIELKRVWDDETIYRKLQRIYDIHPKLAATSVTRAILSSRELEDMAASGLARYGAHTRHHYRLNRLTDESQLEAEILDCMNDIKALSSAHVSVFCYPNGDITHKGQQLVRSAYRAACTTKTGWNRAGCDPYDLQRFNLHDGNSFSPQRLLATIGRGLL